MKPQRIQLKRTKGWRLQEASKALNGLEAVKVTRPGVFGNPFRIQDAIDAGFVGYSAKSVVADFRAWLLGSNELWSGPESYRRRWAIQSGLRRLQGKNLACFCPLDQPCHADVLLELANKDTINE